MLRCLIVRGFVWIVWIPTLPQRGSRNLILGDCLVNTDENTRVGLLVELRAFPTIGAARARIDAGTRA